MRKGSFVTYVAGSTIIRAIVRRLHRDGSATVEARHVLDFSGSPVGCYLGYRYRMAARDLVLVLI